MAETGTETWGDMVRRVADEYGVTRPDDEYADYILWERTAFPIASPEHVERQVREFMSKVEHPCIGGDYCGRTTNGWFDGGSHGPGWYCGWCECIPDA